MLLRPKGKLTCFFVSVNVRTRITSAGCRCRNSCRNHQPSGIVALREIEWDLTNELIGVTLPRYRVEKSHLDDARRRDTTPFGFITTKVRDMLGRYYRVVIQSV